MSADPSITLPPLSPSPEIPPLPEKSPVSRSRWAVHLVIMASLPIIAGFAGKASRGEGPALTDNVRGLLFVTGYEVLFFAVIFGLAWLFSRATRDDLLLRWRPGYWVVPLGALYSVAIRLAVGVIALIAASIFMVITRPSMSAVQNFAQANRPKVEALVDFNALSHNPVYFWLTLALVSPVVGGLREELWRSSFLAGLRSIWPRTFASERGGYFGAAVAALFFGLGHYPQGWLAMGMITIVGFLLGVIMTVHRSIWPAAVAHGLFDATSVAMLPFALHQMK
ncbi:Abortive infection protein [Chthoniobacter flavus Ellin428]|uniref:Abortive infection protein n=1 Tax=Chthoniobacter flavus Ellin428 TaxID=497964 RepID=B4CYY0_9BACT|nr:type II CAAX endopeptidase family protein [Chthoniobacter flavus]EDY20671.1 Abortive infection protein [Chthoniobacter flavus Ellin428]TCO89571.1 CAAX prenyl protease-like protein [Chthoniobacter flavus]